ncbi:type 1 glutamine amidotransferase [Mycobacterium sp. C31M]
MAAPILELRHIECEPTGSYLPTLQKYGPVQTVRLWREPIPARVSDFAAIVVMGGPMGADDGHRLRWIDDEIAFLRRAVDAGIGVWGVCLGAQLLAAALGARVYTGAVPEVGITAVDFAPAAATDPVWDIAESEISVLQWHSDTFELPAGATLLASSAAYRHQVFRHGSSYGVQFHLEADLTLAQVWLAVPEYRAALEAAIGAGAVPDLMAAIAAGEDAARTIAETVMDRWLSIVTA